MTKYNKNNNKDNKITFKIKEAEEVGGGMRLFSDRVD